MFSVQRSCHVFRAKSFLDALGLTASHPTSLTFLYFKAIAQRADHCDYDVKTNSPSRIKLQNSHVWSERCLKSQQRETQQSTKLPQSPSPPLPCIKYSGYLYTAGIFSAAPWQMSSYYLKNAAKHSAKNICRHPKLMSRIQLQPINFLLGS